MSSRTTGTPDTTVVPSLDKAAETLAVMLQRTAALSRDIRAGTAGGSTAQAMRDLRVTCLQVADLFDPPPPALQQSAAARDTTPHQPTNRKTAT